MNIRDDLLRGIYSYGFESPSEIQKNATKPFIDGHDIIAQAQSGTGKTGAITIGTLQSIDLLGGTQAIVLIIPSTTIDSFFIESNIVL